MLSSHSSIRAFVLLSLFLVFVHAHDVPIVQRDHASIQRMMKKRAPQGLPPIFGNVQGGAAADSSSTTTTTTSSAASTSSASSSTSSGSASGSQTTTGSSSSTSGTETATSSTATSTSASTTTTPSPVAPTPAPAAAVGNTRTVTGAGSTFTASVNATPTPQADAQGNVSINSKSTTLTVLIAVAASIGGVAILWTIFRKWKLSSSKKFDQRLNPDWRPPTITPDDNPIPTHRRRTSNASSFNSGSGHGTSLEHDFTVGPTQSTPVGGYADLSRGTNPQMQENPLNRDPSFNRGYDYGVPLHHQTPGAYGNNNSGPYEAYDYEGRGVRY